MSFLSIYRASAGSGKTHTLTLEYLKLAFQSAERFKNILAVTFTNKAAEEMKERILKELNNIIELGALAPVYGDLKKEFPLLSDDDFYRQALSIRNNILHNYSQFSIGTIDSFVQKIVRAFAFEIGAKAGYKIEMDNEKVIDDLTEILYKRIHDNLQLQKWLIQYAFHKIEEGKDWDFRDEMKNLAQEIFKEKYQQQLSQNQISDHGSESENEDVKDKLQNFHHQLKTIRYSFEDEMKRFGEKTNKILSNHAIDTDEHSRDFNTIINYLTYKITQKQDYQPTSTIYAAIDNPEKWKTKKSTKQVEGEINTIFPVLNDLLKQTVAYYTDNYKHYNSAKQILINFHSFGILNDIASLLPEYREENNLLLITDTTLLLKKIIAGNETPFVYEKIGNKFQHLLIDEFQDTSGFQWENFKPLIAGAISTGNKNLIVGDIKQSIYRWRGGDWKLLLQKVKSDIGSEFITDKSLDTNWRSKKNIIDFNNSLFQKAAELLQNSYNNDLNEIINEDDKQLLIHDGFDKILTDSYHDVYQFLAPKAAKSGGRVKLIFFKTERAKMTKQWQELVNPTLPQTIDNLLKNKNYLPKDICILVRRNSEGNKTIKMLLEYTTHTPGAIPYDIISAESLFLTNAPSIRLIIAAIHYIYDNRDDIHLASLVYEYNRLNETQIPNHSLFNSKNDNLKDYVPEEFMNNLNSLRKLSLYDLSEKLISVFELQTKIEEYPYIRTFQDTILTFTKNQSSDLALFIEWWKNNGNKVSIQLSDKQNAVRIMTIHKSKGLAFKVVIIPFCDWKLDHSSQFTSPILWCSSNEKPFCQFDSLPVKYKKDLMQTVFQRDYFDEKLYAYMDAINMLYVAFTRPVEELIIFAPTDESDKLSSVADLLYHSIKASCEFQNENKFYSDLKKYFDSDTGILEMSSGYNEIDKEKFLREKQDENHFMMDDYPNIDWQDRISINYESQEFFIESIQQIADKVNYGIFMHEIFSKIKTAADVDDVLQEMYFAGKITSSEKKELFQKIEKAISKPEVAEWFSDKWEIKTESSLITNTGEIKIPDRVLISENKTIVIDFKFGEKKDDYFIQINEYKRLLSDAGYQNVEGYIFYVEEDCVIKC